MANKKISELGITTNPSISDVLPIVHNQTTTATSIGNIGNAILSANFPMTSSAILVNGDVTLSGSLFISGNIDGVEHLQFQVPHTDTPTIGELCWNDADTTLNLGITSDVILQIGQELHFPKVVNKDSVDLQDGTLVMLNPNDPTVGQRMSVIRWDSQQQYPSSYIIGICTAPIIRNQEGFVTKFGYVRGLSISTLETSNLKDPIENWGEGELLYPSVTLIGGLTTVRPVGPYVKSIIGITTAVNGNNLTIMVDIKSKASIEELYNVNFYNTATGSLIYNSGSEWDTTVDSIIIQEPYVLLTHISESLNFTDDSAAGIGGVPLGGLYRNGSIIQIRIN